MPSRPPLTPTALYVGLWLTLAGTAQAQALQEVVVSANRQEQKTFDAPAAVQAVGQDVIGVAGPRVNLSESLNRVPGITVLNRQNYAQDLQLSIRGSGSRSPFGIRGARLIVDGIPATMPDGQGQASTISLPSAGRIEVLRGPLAQLYGNSSAGVVQVFTADGPARPEVLGSLDAGSDGLQRRGLQAAGQQGSLNYLVDLSDFRTDGWRQNSAAERRHLNARLRTEVSDQTRLTVVANVFDQPVSGDPLGLTRAQLATNPRQADIRSTEYQAGKDVSQRQIGLVLDHRLDGSSELMARAYAGQRDLESRLSIPLMFQQAPTAAGGIVELDREYSGTGLRYSRRTPLGEGQLSYSIGLDLERLSERRRGFINNFGVRGELKRDEDDSVQSTGVYAQADWAINEDWSAVAGLRANRVAFKVEDFYIRPGNPDDSGRARFSATNPVIGLTRHLGPDRNLYVNVGRGFETPTFTEIAYRVGGSGPNLDLKAARSTHVEFGYKARLTPAQRLDVALFHIGTSDEIVVAASSGGRTIYTNAGKTRRSGIEIAHSARWAAEWQTHLAFSTLNARFAEAFSSGGGALVSKGNRLPGTLDRQLFAELAWKPETLPGISAALEVVHLGRMAVDDLNTDRTEAATVFHLRLGWEQTLGAWTLKSYLRVDNLADKAYVGSVIANEGNRRFFEPAPGRQWGLGVSAAYRF
ncbi:MAG: TonB-dependent receptor [Hydrogenophaga sp.]|uniref:TonB-dependent receptor family protein n=2 Tax=Hydrogenophaga sp. TaxID=1904254 RepID=UPI002723D5E7|nr:TonB-dependent receptor [Hydrogenophaga sp.]MDO9147540.1 TonB-dependent receptor [Hydrogenophaga sp.]MDO9606795.1 TonB-dependent receptor [Hydrogenophaga sp.]MDP2165428.1 TonB-dependent receptor [Hydrogenophaga sp.]MDP3477171.1 TonB-dependent receptor [Hydrogenophaga sp.]